MVASWEILDAATAMRKRLLRAGFLPIPAAGKKPPLAGWSGLVATEAEIDSWFYSYPEAMNTGILTRTTPAVDIDVCDPDVAAEIEALLWEMIGTRSMVRFGQQPKRAVLFRTATPFAKISTPVFTSPTQQRHRVEVLADGQQLIVLGTHPGTGKPYSWHGGEPGDMTRADLPELTEAAAREFVGKAAALMLTQGWTEKSRKCNGATHHDGGGDEFDAIYGDRERKYALAALQGCADELSGMAPDSGRNDKLNKLAFRLGAMCARQWLSRDEVHSRLLAATVACGLVADDGEAATRATLESGFRKGEQAPHPDLDDQAFPEKTNVGAAATDIPVFWHGVNYDRAAAHLWLAKNLIPQQGAGLLAGQWGTAKTFVAIDLGGSVVTGTSFAGREVDRRGGVLFIAAEGAGEIAIRLQGIVDSKLKQSMPSGHDIDLDRLPFAWIEDVPDLKDAASYKRLVTSAVAIGAKIKADFGIELALIIFDTLSAAVNFKDANDAAEGQFVMNKLTALSKATGAFVLAVDHFGKDASAGTRGTSTKEASADVILALLADRDLAGNLSKTRMAVRKVRGGKPGDLFPFDLEVVQLECGDSTCVIRWQPEQKAEATATSARPNWPQGLRVFRTSMQAMILDHGEPLRPYGVDGPSVQAVRKDHVRTEFMLAYPADDADGPRAQRATKRSAFNRAMNGARNRELVGSREVDGTDLLWFTDQNGANGAN